MVSYLPFPLHLIMATPFQKGIENGRRQRQTLKSGEISDEYKTTRGIEKVSQTLLAILKEGKKGPFRILYDE